MKNVGIEDVKQLTISKPDSHKGQNGKLLVIGGSHLFHAASLWSLTVASRIVDLVHYCSVPENNAIVHELKKEFRNGIVVPRDQVEEYIKEDDVILIGPGMTREEETKKLTDKLLKKYPEKQWVLDAGALQMVDVNNIPNHAILTPHHQEFKLLLRRAEVVPPWRDFPRENVCQFAKIYNCIVLLKGKEDVASNGEEIRIIEGGNAGMTKGGTGDVLAGLIAALACTNNPWISTLAGSFINKKAGDELFATVGPFFNATDLANQIPKTMGEMLKDFK
jgi:NAD(P)H-hydrate epimerase